MQIDLKKYGKFDLNAPASVATCLDYVMIWGGSPNKAQLVRLYASAIAICTGCISLPRYNVATGDPIAHGHLCLERLITEAKLDIADIADIGISCLGLMMQQTAVFNEVEERENFTSQNGDP